jgi:cell wall-associated NlpC family hydrolase
MGVLLGINLMGQENQKLHTKLEKLYQKSPEKCIDKSMKLAKKKKSLSSAYYFICEANMQLYEETERISYFKNSLRYYEKFNKLKQKHSLRIPSSTKRKLIDIHNGMIKLKMDKGTYESALSLAKKHYKYFSEDSKHKKEIEQKLNAKKEELAKKVTQSEEKAKRPEKSKTVAKAKPTINLGILMKEAERLIGTPYQYGGEGPRYDCSGYVKHCYKQVGIQLPHSATQMSKMGKKVSRKDCKTGDLIFFGKDSKIQHVGMIHKNDDGVISIIHCPNSGIESISPGDGSYDYYWADIILFIKTLN